MAVIPRYAAQIPAAPDKPFSLESGAGRRLSAGQAVQGLGDVASAIRAGSPRLARMDASQGQGVAGGTEVLGQGMKQLGQAIFDIQERVADARNYADVNDAQIALDREVGEFEEWKMRTPDTTRWVDEWNNKIATFAGSYGQGKNLSPAAERAIRERIEGMGQRHGLKIGLEAAKQEIGRAGEALRADIMRAVAGKDGEQAAALARMGVEKGWIGEDEAARLEIQARERIDEDRLSEARNLADAFVISGDIDAAREQLDSVKDLMRGGEYEKSVAIIENKARVTAELSELRDMAVEESPGKAAELLEEKNKDGSFKAFPSVKGAMRQQEIQRLWNEHFQERNAVFAGIKESISNGAIRSADDLKEQLGEFEPSKEELGMLLDVMKGQYIKDSRYAQQAFVDAASYDPSKDPSQRIAGEMMSRWATMVDDEDKLSELMGVMEKRMSGESLTMGERTRVALSKEVQALQDAQGGWRVPASNIKQFTDEHGETVYVDITADLQPGDEGAFEYGKTVWGRKSKIGRKLLLSQDDQIKVSDPKKRKGAVVTDILQKNKAAKEEADILDALNQDIDSGKIQTSEQGEQRVNGLLLPVKESGARGFLESSLFPSTGGTSSVDDGDDDFASVPDNDDDTPLGRIRALGNSINDE